MKNSNRNKSSQKKKKDKKKFNFSFILVIPVVSFIVAAIISLSGTGTIVNDSFYDFFLGASASPVENENILLLDIDDNALEKRDVWPWRRGIYADSLFVLAEFDAAYVLFDIEFSEKSPAYVDPEFFREDVLGGVEYSFRDVSDSVSQLLDSVSEGWIRPKDLGDYSGEIISYIDEQKSSLVQLIEKGVADNDIYFGQGLASFGNSYSAITLLKEESSEISDELYAVFSEKILSSPEVTDNALKPDPGIRMIEDPILRGLKGTGFSNVVIDKDGTRRRIELIKQYDNYYVPQLAFAILYDLLGRPDVKITRKKIILENIFSDAVDTDKIVIPRDPQGYFLIDWPEKDFYDSYEHLSFWYILDYIDEEKALIRDLEIAAGESFNSDFQGKHPLEYIEEFTMLRDALLETGHDKSLMAQYRASKEGFYASCELFFSEQSITDFKQQFESMAESASEADKAMYLEYADAVGEFLDFARLRVQQLAENRSRISAAVENSICITGNTATSTSDRGVNPFDNEFENAGTHASIINTVLNESFIDEMHFRYPALITFFLCAILFLILKRLKSVWQAAAGFAFICVTFAIIIMIFVFGRYFIPSFEILLAEGLTVVGMTIWSFATTSREKAFIRNAFSHYLSSDVINNIIEDPESLTLGGQKRFMTAMFTDVKGFSTISEGLEPEQLVKLLNMYLSDLSDVALDLGGTIDKYEGDAIICFFGAPLDMHNHAEMACLAAIRMKRAEKNLNNHLISEGILQTPLLTRIGVNSGDMVVGNMGTLKKMDYTIMGNSVNLAARLEGVNKQYGTWLLISEDAYKNGGHLFQCRKLDRVRVVGISKPIRLYELVEEKDVVSAEKLKAIDLFEEALDKFENREWHEAELLFKDVLKILPDDGPSEKFIKRCKVFEVNPPADNWDGVFNLTEK